MNEKLLPLLNNIPALMALDWYLSERIDSLKREFMSAKDMNTVVALQQTIFELQRLRKLREEYIKES